MNTVYVSYVSHVADSAGKLLLGRSTLVGKALSFTHELSFFFYY